MRLVFSRVWAALLLAAISSTLMPAALLASPDSDLPACCRKDGKHKCGMASMMDDASGPTLRGVSKCDSYPTKSTAAPVAPVSAAVAPDSNLSIHFAAFLNRPAQIEAQYRISFNRSRQKRGPPSFSL